MMANSEKLLLLSVFGILLLIFIGDFFIESYSGEVLSIERFHGRIILEVSGINSSVVIFEEDLGGVSVGETLSFNGRKGTYLGQEQIIASKIWKSG